MEEERTRTGIRVENRKMTEIEIIERERNGKNRNRSAEIKRAGMNAQGEQEALQEAKSWGTARPRFPRGNCGWGFQEFIARGQKCLGAAQPSPGSCAGIPWEVPRVPRSRWAIRRSPAWLSPSSRAVARAGPRRERHLRQEKPVVELEAGEGSGGAGLEGGAGPASPRPVWDWELWSCRAGLAPVEPQIRELRAGEGLGGQFGGAGALGEGQRSLYWGTRGSLGGPHGQG